uniref:Uncharacterized protein n=1 Tax=Arundo donax TaxID=35708 RepID=A0A0A9FF28_ARUDO
MPLEGAEAGGGAVHGRRCPRRSDSTEWSPAARRGREVVAEMGKEAMATGRER